MAITKWYYKEMPLELDSWWTTILYKKVKGQS